MQIRVGVVDGNTMRIGFQPPLSDIQQELIGEICPTHPSSPDSTMHQVSSEEGVSYTAVDVTAICNNSEWLEGMARSIAHRSAGVLSQSGEDARYDHDREVCALGWGEVLFSSPSLHDLKA